VKDSSFPFLANANGVRWMYALALGCDIKEYGVESAPPLRASAKTGSSTIGDQHPGCTNGTGFAPRSAESRTRPAHAYAQHEVLLPKAS